MCMKQKETCETLEVFTCELNSSEVLQESGSTQTCTHI